MRYIIYSAGFKYVLLFTLLFVSTANCLGQWIPVKLSGDVEEQLSLLPPEEKMEQYRDWLKFSLAGHVGLDQQKCYEALFDFDPLRKQYTQGLSTVSYGEGRSIALNTGTLYLLVPYGSPRSNVIRNTLIDKYRLTYGTLPVAVNLYSYQIDTLHKACSFRLEGRLDAREAYTSTAGYVEQRVSNRQELQQFLMATNDLLLVKLQADGSVVLGGRNMAGMEGPGALPRKKVNFEDVCVIYQAERQALNKEIERITNRGLYGEYNNWISQRTAKLIQSNPFILDKYSRFDIEDTLQSRTSYEEFLKLYLDDVRQQGEAIHIGFSLDPELRHQELADALGKLVAGDTVFLRTWFNERIKQGLTTSLIQSDSIEQFMSFDYPIQSDDNMDSALSSFMEIATGKQTAVTVDSFILTRLSDTSAYIRHELEKVYAAIQQSILTNKNILRKIIHDIRSEKSERKMALYNLMTAYLDRYYSFEIKAPLKDTMNAARKTLYEKIIRDATVALHSLGYLDIPVQTQYTPALKAAVKRFQKSMWYYGLDTLGAIDNSTYRVLLGLNDSLRSENSALDILLTSMRKNFAFQKARYDGNFQGSETGMTMFYTDLMMKLWSFNYQGSSPKGLGEGFVPMTNYLWSDEYEEQFSKLPATRSWLGLLRSGYSFHNNNKELYFSDCATHIYNASSNDLFPGIETEANASSERFSTWWNEHYLKIADYEPEYHRLNQLIKWSLVLNWMKKTNNVAFLATETPVSKGYDFQQWYASNSSLRVRTPLPFLDKRKLSEKTECIDILTSSFFQSFYNYPNLLYTIQGGVSLGDKRALQASLNTSKPVALLKSGFNRPELEFGQSSFNAIKLKEVKFILEPTARNIRVIPSAVVKFQAKDAEIFSLSATKKVVKTPRELSLIQKTPHNVFLGSTKTRQANEGIELFIEQSDIDKYKQYLENRDDLFREVQGEAQEFTINGENYLKLKGTNSWAHLKEVSKKERAGLLADQLVIRKGASRNEYLYAQLLNERTITNRINQQQYLMIDDEMNPIRFVNRIPDEATNEFTIVSGTYQNKASVSSFDECYLKRVQLSEDVKVLSAWKRQPGSVTSGLAFNTYPRAYFYEEGRLFQIYKSANTPTGSVVHEMSDLSTLLSLEGSGIRTVVIGKGSAIRLPHEQVLEIPALHTLTAEQRTILQEINKKLSEGNGWAKVLANAREITHADMLQLGQLQKGNATLGESYFKFKTVNNLEDDMVLVDVRSSSTEAQVLIKRKDGMPEVRTYAGLGGEVTQEGVAFSKLYERNGGTADEFIKGSEQYAAILRKIDQDLPGSRIILVEPEGINSQLVNKLHSINPQKVFYRDESLLQKSIMNVKTDIYPDAASTVVLSVPALDDSSYAAIQAQYSQLKNMNLVVKDHVSFDSLEKYMKDKHIRQLALVIRGNEKGVYFSDGFMSYYTLLLSMQVWKDADKELLYVISNVGNRLEPLLAETHLFSRIVTSQFIKGKLSSLERCLDNLKTLYKQAVIELNLQKATPGYKPKNIDKLLEGIQESRLQEIRKTYYDLEEVIKSFPIYKCAIRKKEETLLS